MNKVVQEDTSSDLYMEILEKLIEDESLNDRARALLDAALRGEDKLAAAVEQPVDALTPPSRRESAERAKPPRVFLEQVSVQAFRGAGPKAVLPLRPGPGLTLVVGRNGTGKSTFVDGLEALLTGTTARWDERKEWGAGWKNLGSSLAPELTCRLWAEGVGHCSAKRSWTVDAQLEESQFSLEQTSSGKQRSIDWAAACASERPILGYRQLATVVEKPSSVFDALHSVLGLELFDTASKRIDILCKRLKASQNEVEENKIQAVSALQSSSGEAATELLELLQQQRPQLDAIENSLVRVASAQGEEDPALLRFTRADFPSAEEWSIAIDKLATATVAFQSASSKSLEGNDALLEILETTLPRIHETTETCPVCESSLSPEKIEAIRNRAEMLRQSTRTYRAAEKALKAAQATGLELARRVLAFPAVVNEQLAIPLEAKELEELAKELEATPERALAALRNHEPLPGVLLEAQSIAAKELERRGLELKKLTRPVEVWLQGARETAGHKETLSELRKAKKWLKDTAEIMRNDRFAPLAEATISNWKTLGADSSVLLTGVKLAGSKTSRKLDLRVEIDGKEAPGVAVLSQGEVNCMALSLFLPRAIEQEGPFQFVLIDDPVQAMDQIKVDGLAQVLHNAARHLQVVVFTHDTRLVNSVRRQQLPTSILDVRRRANSELVVEESVSPVKQYLRDAFAVAKSKNTGEELPARIVPGFCRMAVEAACQEKVYLVRLERGETFEEVDELLRSNSFFDLVGLALFDAPARGGDVARHLKEQRAFKECSALFNMKQTHGHGFSASRDDLKELVHWTEALCKRLQGAS